MRILFVASEGLPFSKTGGLADVVEALPKALVAAGHEVAVVLPRYRGTKVSTVVLPSVTIPMGGTRLRFPSVADGSVISGVRYFFVDDPDYFDRDGLYGGSGGDYPDNAERYSEFCRVAIEIAKHVWRPDVIHCHDWQSALVPVLLRTTYGDDPLVRDIPVVFTIHNMGYHGLFGKEALDRAGIPVGVFHPGGIEFFGSVNFLKGGLVFSDYLTTVSRKYAQEIQTREYGYGLDGVVRGRADRLVGILNGTGTGFKFVEYIGAAMMRSVRLALHLFMDERIWRRIQLNCMAKDFSWKGSAMEYANVYAAARTARGLPAVPEPAPAPAARNQKPVATSN